MKITIEHNHGYIVLDDISFEEYESGGRRYRAVIGTVLEGRSTSSYLQYTNTTHEPVGELVKRCIYGYVPMDTGDGHYRVDMRFCG